MSWLAGGPATIDLWDLKPGHTNGGPSREIATTAPGLKISQHLPGMARWGKELAVVRSMSTKEGDHGRATYLLRTGNLPVGGIEFPTLGSLVAKELRPAGTDLPPFISIAPQRFLAQNAFGPGFLGPEFAPLLVADGQRAVANARADVDQQLKVQNLGRFGGVTAHTFAVLSAPAETSFVPSALIPMPLIAPSWAAIDLSSLPSAAFQNLIVLSSPAETISPLGLKIACRTGPAWTACQRRETFQIRAVLSALAATMRLPSP